MRIFRRRNWSKWKDILIFNFGGCSFLLQGKVDGESNLKRFKVTKAGGDNTHTAETGAVESERLEELNLFNKK